MNLHESGLWEKCCVYLRHRHSDIEWKLSFILKYPKCLFSQLTRPQLIQRINQDLILNKMSIRNMPGCCCIVYMCCMLHVDWNISRIWAISTTNKFNELQKTFNVQNYLWIVCVCYITSFTLALCVSYELLWWKSITTIVLLLKITMFALVNEEHASDVFTLQ